MTNLANILHDIRVTRGLSDDLIYIIIEDFLKAAYKKKYATDENAEVVLDIDNNEIALYARKTIVEDVQDPILEIDSQSAKELESECEIGDQLLIEINPNNFSRSEVMTANQKAMQKIKEFEGNTLYSEFKSKLGEIVIGYFLREINGNIIVDLGKTEGMLPKKYQSSKDNYHSGDRIKALIYEVKKQGNHFEVILSRSHTDFISKIFELEVPELYEGVVEIVKIVREAGYRTKIAVRSRHSEVDPIGTCVGTKGARINNVMLELDGERIDILKYDPDPLTFIHNALSPAEVKQVVIVDYAKRAAIAVVDDSKFSIAIGKLGLNVRLANRLTDWTINVKTSSQFQEIEQTEEFSQVFETITESETGEEIDITRVDEIPSLDKAIVKKLNDANIEYIEDLVQLSNVDLEAQNLTEDEIATVRKILHEFIDIDIEKGVSSESTDDVVAEDGEESDEEATLSQLPFSKDILDKLVSNSTMTLYDLIELYSNDTLDTLTYLTQEDIEHIRKVIAENVEIE